MQVKFRVPPYKLDVTVSVLDHPRFSPLEQANALHTHSVGK